MKCCGFVWWGYCYPAFFSTHKKNPAQKFQDKSCDFSSDIFNADADCTDFTAFYKSKCGSLSYVIHPSVGGVWLVLRVRLTSACVIFICSVVWISVIFQGNLSPCCHSNPDIFSVFSFIKALYCINQCELRKMTEILSCFFDYYLQL